MNRAGCGALSHITASSMCSSPPTVPDSIAASLAIEDPTDHSNRRLRVSIARVRCALAVVNVCLCMYERLFVRV